MPEEMDPVTYRTRLVRMLRTGEARGLRERIHMSQAELAQQLGVERVSVHRWETGQGVPRDLKVVVRWINLLDMVAKEMDELEDVPPRPAASLRYSTRRRGTVRPTHN